MLESDSRRIGTRLVGPVGTILIELIGWEKTIWTRNMWKQCWCWWTKIHLTSWYRASLYDISQLVQDFFDQQWCISYFNVKQNLSCKNSKSCSTCERIDQSNWNSWSFRSKPNFLTTMLMLKHHVVHNKETSAVTASLNKNYAKKIHELAWNIT